MKITNKIFEIKLKKPLTLEFIENWFEERKLTPVRWAITDVREGAITLNAAVIEEVPQT